MSDSGNHLGRRQFIWGAALTALGAAAGANPAMAQRRAANNLQVWSCGGLAEAFMPANAAYEKKTGTKVAYTGAFAAALGKSLLGSATTEVFAGRVLGLAKKLRKAGKMVYFRPLCFTSYVLVTPKGNPAGIGGIQDLAKPGVRVILAPQASPPGGKAATVLLKKAGVVKAAMKNSVIQGSCVQRTMEELIQGKADVSVVEARLTRMPEFQGQTEIIPIPEKYFPPPPLTFTIGVMKHAADRKLADDYVEFITSAEGQAHFERAGFIPAISEKGQMLCVKLGVKDA